MEIYQNVYAGMPVIIAPSKRQRRTHKKKRINKKWAKRYGYRYGLEKGQAYVIDNKLYMTKESYLILKRALEKEKNLEGQELRTV